MTERAHPGVFDRLLVTASAGSGKTFQLSSRMVGLLAAGADPDSILASTFTRKAAGEILERVLLRLARAALSPEEAAALAASLPPGIPPERTTREGFEVLLLGTVGELHRLQVQTLDAFVNRAVRAFALELGLPATWQMADDSRNARLRARALEEVLGGADPGALLALLRLVQMGGARRSVHEALLRVLAGVHALYRERDPADPGSPWGFEGGKARWGATDEPPAERWARHLARVNRAFEAQEEERGLTGHWVNARNRILGALATGDARELVAQTLWTKALDPEADPPSYSRRPIHPELVDAFQALASDIPALEGPAWQDRMEALGRLVPEYDRRLSALRRAEGLFDFDDLVHALAGAGALGRTDELYYRLDGRIRHLLLDEFQDTSVLQWAALRPLVDELLSGYRGERAFFLVADPKQSIYGWRGGEPRLLDEIRERYTLTSRSLSSSWRSSPVVLDFVNAVFQELPDNPVLSDSGDAELAAGWMEGFESHRAEREELSGYVRLAVGPDPGVEAGEDPAPAGVRKEALLQAAAEAILALHREAPSRTLGVLVRKNATAARLMALLRELGVEASEEGGVPVVDAAPVLAVLALLRVADHPGDGASAYLVAHSPLGPRVGLRVPTELEEVERVAQGVRVRLLDEGYGPVVRSLAELLRPGATPRDARRLDQLVELAFAHEEHATLRPADFVRAVEKARREDPAAAPIRIMTIHRSKGLEFDAVFLPELDESRGGRAPEALGWRETPGGPIRRILPSLPASLAGHFPELAPVLRQRDEAELRDWLSGLYVAITRARHAVYGWLVPDGKSRSTARSWARLLREAPGLRGGAGFRFDALDGKGKLVQGATLFESGDPRWFREEGREALSAPEAASPPRTPEPVRLAPSRRPRLLPRQTPSGLEGGSRVGVSELLAPRPKGALDRGTLVHAWLEEIEWLDPDRPPTREALLARGQALAPGFQGLDGLADRFLEWLEAPEIRALLLREAWPAGTRVIRELPFVVRTGGHVLQGVADRVLRIPAGAGSAPRLVVVDWKTDRVTGPERGLEGEPGSAFEARVERYRPQVEAYLDALARLEGLGGGPPPAMEGILAFLEAGRSIRVAPRDPDPADPTPGLEPAPGG